MRQSIIIKPKTSKIVDKDMPDFGDNEVLVRVRACGVCASSFMEVAQWYKLSTRAGHEAARRGSGGRLCS